MCYDIQANLKAQLKTARYYRDDPILMNLLREKIDQLKIFEFHHVSGFQHPVLPVVTGDSEHVHLATWGLIPSWTKDLESGLKFYNQTLNARSETIFEKPSFRQSARDKRCILMVDGFYEHHHYRGRTYPFFIAKPGGEPFPLACLWNRWESRDRTTVMETFAIVTTRGNDLLARIHNNPKMEGPRMPVILPEELIGEWLTAEVRSSADAESLVAHCCRPWDAADLRAHTVHPVRGKQAPGNVPEASQEFLYEELDTYRDIIAA